MTAGHALHFAIGRCYPSLRFQVWLMRRGQQDLKPTCAPPSPCRRMVEGGAIRDHVTTTGAWEGLGLGWVPMPPVRVCVQDCGALGTGKGSCSPERVDEMDFFILPWTFGGSWRKGWGGHRTGLLRKLVPLQGMNLFSSPLLFWGVRGLKWGCVL